MAGEQKTILIPVIALTGYGSVDFGEGPGEPGFSGFITKPIEVRSFIETISGYLGGGLRTPEA